MQMNSADVPLLVLAARGAVHPGATCAYGAKPPNMSRISDALVSREFITRVLSVRDRRRMVLRISERGGQPVRELLPQLFRCVDRSPSFPRTSSAG